ncbi:MAG: thioesterase domain-containing protein, partial [Ilumatobacteraceae bacterium]
MVVLPGRDPRVRATSGARPPGTMAELVGPSLRAIAELQAANPMPFAIFGHSMGAIIAFELTVAMEAATDRSDRIRRPAHLFVSGRR